jgi:predicted Zn-dependent protease
MTRPVQPPISASLLIAAVAVIVTACAAPDIKPGQGVNVGDASTLRKIVPAEDLEQSSQTQYGALLQEAAGKGLLAKAGDPQLARLQRISKRIIPQAARFNSRATAWTWDVNLIKSAEINAFCMPGGKIAFYTGILETLKLTDDEVGVIMGHEMAHALREHGREQIAKQGLTKFGSEALATIVGGAAGTLVKSSAGLLSLKFSRDDETDADLVGLELAARAGFDPKAGVSLWKKMAAAAKGAPHEWFSTHPSSDSRITTIESNLPAVVPLYKAAKSSKSG